MLQHEIDKLAVAPLRVGQTQAFVQIPFVAQHGAGGAAQGGHQRLQGFALGWRLEVFNNHGLYAAGAQQCQHRARSAAGGVVVDRGGHGENVLEKGGLADHSGGCIFAACWRWISSANARTDSGALPSALLLMVM